MLKIIFRVASLILGLAGLVFMMIRFTKPYSNIIHIVLFILSIVLIFIGIFFKPFLIFLTDKKFLYMRIVFLSGIIFFILTYVINYIAIKSFAKNIPDANADAVIVLGAGIRGEVPTDTLRFRLNKAVEYLNENKNTIAVVSGGQGKFESITEALAMERYLISKGISKERILQEDKSTSTKENFKFSKEVLDKHFENDNYKVVFVTSDFHILRSLRYAIDTKLDAEGLASITLPPSVYNSYFREYLALMKYWVLDFPKSFFTK